MNSTFAPGPKDRCIEVDGFRFVTDDANTLGIGEGAGFEPHVLAALMRWTRAGDTVVDIGANIGYFTAHLARQVGPVGQVHAFEPEAENFRRLSVNMRANGLNQVWMHHAALGAESRDAELHVSVGNIGMHRLYESVCCDGPAQQVRVRTLDDVLGAQRVDLIKVDIEGYEWMALSGAQQCLRANRRIVVVSEYCAPSMLEAGISPLAYLELMAEQGLMAHDLDGQVTDAAELRADARAYDAFGAQRFIDACKGCGPGEIDAIVVQVAGALGCQRPFIENLVFMRPD
jgi:FkbM family methyltransferase